MKQLSETKQDVCLINEKGLFTNGSGSLPFLSSFKTYQRFNVKLLSGPTKAISPSMDNHDVMIIINNY